MQLFTKYFIIVNVEYVILAEDQILKNKKPQLIELQLLFV